MSRVGDGGGERLMSLIETQVDNTICATVGGSRSGSGRSGGSHRGDSRTTGSFAPVYVLP